MSHLPDLEGAVVALTWWGVVNPQGHLSEVYAMRGLAESAIGGRGDGQACWLVSVRLEVDLTRPTPALPPPKGRRKKS
jgi:hypothetical protein